MIFSVTGDAEKYLRCRRQWDFSSVNRQSLTPVMRAPALGLGSMIHSTLADWRASPSKDPTLIYQANYMVDYEEMREAYREHVGCYPSQEELAPTHVAMDLGYNMIANYAKVHKTPLPEGYRLVSNEQTFVVPVDGTSHCECHLLRADEPEPCTHHCPRCELGWYDGMFTCNCRDTCPCVDFHYYEGTMDALVADSNNRIFPYECKSYSRKPSDNLLRRAHQFTSYLWILAHPTVNMPALSMQFDGLYKKATAMSGKTLEDNFIRKLLTRRPEELDEMSRLLPSLLNEMAAPQPTPLAKTVPYLHGGCWDCSFEPLCDAISYGESLVLPLSMYVKHDHKLWSRSRKVWETDNG